MTHQPSKSNEIVNLKEWWELQSVIDAIQCGRPVAKPDKDFLENLATAITNAKDAERERAVESVRVLVRKHGQRLADGDFKAIMRGLTTLTPPEDKTTNV